MLKQIREKAPFILIGVNLTLVVFKYFGMYSCIFKYLGDLVGYSILTNIFMYSIYINKKYCVSTKIAVLGLFSLNILSLIWTAFVIDGLIYDLFLILITIIILLFYKIQK